MPRSPTLLLALVVVLSSSAPYSALADGKKPAAPELPPRAPSERITLLPDECDEIDECLCIRGGDVEAIAKDSFDLERCLAREEALRPALDRALARIPEGSGLPPPAFWQRPEIVIGGMVVSLAVGGLIGWAATR